MSVAPQTRASIPLPPRAPMPAWEHAALRRTGALCGALVGASVGLGGGVLLAAVILGGISALLWLVVGPLFALGLFSAPPDPYEVLPLWALSVLGASMAIGLAALVVGWLRLSHWPRWPAVGVTLAAAALTGPAVHCMNVAVVPLVLHALEARVSLEAAHVSAVAASGIAGAAIGALVGRHAWAGMGHAMRPRWWRPEASAPLQALL